MHLDKDPSTISKEVRHRRMRLSSNATWRVPNKCIHRIGCTINDLCDRPDCPHELCRRCNKCNSICKNFQEEHCRLLSKPPYVCNGCESMRKCTLTKYVYQAVPAHRSYQTSLSDCRVGLSYTESEVQYMDEVITPLVKKKQSIHHICVTQADNILCSERTVYKKFSAERYLQGYFLSSWPIAARSFPTRTPLNTMRWANNVQRCFTVTPPRHTKSLKLSGTMNSSAWSCLKVSPLTI